MIVLRDLFSTELTVVLNDKFIKRPKYDHLRYKTMKHIMLPDDVIDNIMSFLTEADIDSLLQSDLFSSDSMRIASSQLRPRKCPECNKLEYVQQCESCRDIVCPFCHPSGPRWLGKQCDACSLSLDLIDF